MAEQFTPGPWIIEEMEDGEFAVFAKAGEPLPLADYLDRQTADLIAAAPELREALAEAIELLDDCEIAHPFKWEAALAKARGEQA